DWILRISTWPGRGHTRNGATRSVWRAHTGTDEAKTRARFWRIMPAIVMSADPLLLARAQFGLNIGFHILFPSITIALAWVLLYLSVIRFRRPHQPWIAAAYKFWVKIFALSFALGVVSGITMSF